MTNLLTNKYEEALVYTAQLHSSHVRKGSGVPYFSHLMAVSSLVLEHGGNEDEAIAGLLHDAIEDQGDSHAGGPSGLRKEIADKFGDRVLQIVEACTDTDQIPKPPWRERKEVYIAHLADADAGSLKVSCADKIHNARSILTDFHQQGDDLWQIFKGKKDGTLWYYRTLADTFSKHPHSPATLAAELQRTVAELESVAT